MIAQINLFGFLLQNMISKARKGERSNYIEISQAYLSTRSPQADSELASFSPSSSSPSSSPSPPPPPRLTYLLTHPAAGDPALWLATYIWIKLCRWNSDFWSLNHVLYFSDKDTLHNIGNMPLISPIARTGANQYVLGWMLKDIKG